MSDRAWETVLAHVEGLLLTGVLSPGDRLPESACSPSSSESAAPPSARPSASSR
ncbi:hypothetical protein Q0F99_16905 [Rathayibacter oskolensis]|uniref:hypothetical protein n=1 Tax=Rathayibacter oskolensis TaxID=1891671 RepID=UPI00265E085F|nr:hypothetical protein [Rathayibacter oskolensis]WKK71192.1 hypothetical protein Q0F99_16905 [Rathayibacter oskolensis]